MKIYRTQNGIIAEKPDSGGADGPSAWLLPVRDWDALLNREDLLSYLETAIEATAESVDRTTASSGSRSASAAESAADSAKSGLAVNMDEQKILPPLAGQEVWAAGVTYFRSRDARMEESRKSGSGSFYDRVYEADRPELFYKGNARTVVGTEAEVRIRSDSRWNVPEPELTFFINRRQEIIGCTVGNDMSSRDIEGENPLYLPQAKIYMGSCALGPGILLIDGSLDDAVEISMRIVRTGQEVFSGTTTLKELKRSPSQLVEYLFRENDFPAGCFLMTGTGIVPPDSFSLRPGDDIRITVPPVGTLINQVE